jgi:hypothetical protein
LAVMMRDSARGDALFRFDGPLAPASVAWSDNSPASHNSVGSIAYGYNVWPLMDSSAWGAVVVDIPVAPTNYINYHLLMGNEVNLDSFVVGSGPNEALFVGITSPGALRGLHVIWGDQSLTQLDAFPIPNAVVGCAHNSHCSEIPHAHIYWYYLLNPQPGNHRLNVSWASDTTGWGEPLVDVGAVSFSGVDLADPVSSISHSYGLDVVADSVDSLTVPTRPGDETLALWGSIYVDACNWNQIPIVPGDGHGIGYEASRADSTSYANTHSIVHGAWSCDPILFPVGYWGMAGFNIRAADCSVEERVSQEAVCGDQVCGSGETCQSCPADCGACDVCTERYGGTNGFQLCFETETECGVEAVKNSVQSCDDVCSAGGGQCLTIYANDNSNPCVAVVEVPGGCARTGFYDDICVCSR